MEQANDASAFVVEEMKALLLVPLLEDTVINVEFAVGVGSDVNVRVLVGVTVT